jgi:hypothetical protein
MMVFSETFFAASASTEVKDLDALLHTGALGAAAVSPIFAP